MFHHLFLETLGLPGLVLAHCTLWPGASTYIKCLERETHFILIWPSHLPIDMVPSHLQPSRVMVKFPNTTHKLSFSRCNNFKQGFQVSLKDQILTKDKFLNKLYYLGQENSMFAWKVLLMFSSQISIPAIIIYLLIQSLVLLESS